MNRILGIVLIVVGVIAGVFALTQHEDDKTLVDLGKIEIKQQNPKPSNKTRNSRRNNDLKADLSSRGGTPGELKFSII